MQIIIANYLSQVFENKKPPVVLGGLLLIALINQPV
jgi:hypothetical protein